MNDIKTSLWRLEEEIDVMIALLGEWITRREDGLAGPIGTVGGMNLHQKILLCEELVAQAKKLDFPSSKAEILDHVTKKIIEIDAELPDSIREKAQNMLGHRKDMLEQDDE